ncbi:regulatory protein RecX [Sinimarinibacterium thermocellulolyticum]|uniref:Regulatory protein RecX n=1 Tax=Sinimarinibacterium thermocellulolyticum TaxID=3170016 RepID=A0ABV2A5P8_9GAMM
MLRNRSRQPSTQGGRDTALRLLARREHAAAELKDKLVRRGHDDVTAEVIVGELADAGWQSDARYAEMLVRSRIAQGYGPLRIRAELEAARVADAEIREALGSAEVDWVEVASIAHARKFRAPARTAAQWQKQYRFLALRGFEPQQIRAVLRGTPDDI